MGNIVIKNKCIYFDVFKNAPHPLGITKSNSFDQSIGSLTPEVNNFKDDF